MLHPSSNIYKYVGPLLGRSRPGSRPIQTRSRPQPAPIQTTTSSDLKLVIWLFDFCPFFKLLIRTPLTLELMSTVARILTIKLNLKYEHYSWSSWNKSLQLSMWPLAKPQTHLNIWYNIMKTWSSNWGLGNLSIISLYVSPPDHRGTIQKVFRPIPISIIFKKMEDYSVWGIFPSFFSA